MLHRLTQLAALPPTMRKESAAAHGGAGAPPTHRPRPRERTPAFSDYLRVFTYATKWDFVVYVIAAVASIGAGVSLPLMNIIFGQLVGQFTDFFRENSTVTRSQFDALLNRQALYITALFAARWGLNAINKFCFRMIGIRLSSAVRMHYVRALFAQPIHVIDSMAPGAPAIAITATSNTLQLGISERLGTFLEFNGTIWAAIVIAFIWSWDLTLVTSSLILYMMIVLGVILPIVLKGQTATTEADAQGTAIASEALGGIRLVMACGAQDHVISRYEEWVHKAMKRAQKIAPVVGLQLGLVVSTHRRLIECKLTSVNPVFRSVRIFRSVLLVWHEAIQGRRPGQCWRGHHCTNVSDDDSHLLGAHLYATHGGQQGHGRCLRAFRRYRCPSAPLRHPQARHRLRRPGLRQRDF